MKAPFLLSSSAQNLKATPCLASLRRFVTRRFPTDVVFSLNLCRLTQLHFSVFSDYIFSRQNRPSPVRPETRSSYLFCSDPFSDRCFQGQQQPLPWDEERSRQRSSPPRACFHRGHGSGNRRDDTGLPGRARFKRILPIPKPALAQLLGNGGQTVRLGPTWRHNRKVAVRPCAWERGCPVPCSLRGDHSKKAVSGSDPDSSRPALFHRVTMYK